MTLMTTSLARKRSMEFTDIVLGWRGLTTAKEETWPIIKLRSAFK